MTKVKRRLAWREETPATRKRPPSQKRADLYPQQRPTMAPISGLQGKVGNQSVQRMLAQRDGVPLSSIQRKTPEQTLLGGGVPGVKGSYTAALIGDILTVLDTGLTVAELGIPAVETIGASVLGLGTFAAGMSLLASIGFVVASLHGLAEAYKAGDKWAAVMGESYAILYCSQGKKPPSAPGWMKAGAAFNDAAEKARQRISDAVKAKGKSATDMLNVLLSMRKDPEEALNQVYQTLVRQHLRATFLWFKFGGRLYQVAKSYRLTWPEVKAVSK